MTVAFKRKSWTRKAKIDHDIFQSVTVQRKLFQGTIVSESLTLL